MKPELNKNLNDKNIKTLKILSFLVVILLISQTGFVIFYSIKIIQINEAINQAKTGLSTDFNQKLNINNAELQSKINELAKNLLETKTDLTQQVGSIKAKTSSDFSGIIDSAIASVVTIRTDVAQGTGFIISSDGYVVTNAHVLYDATAVEAITSSQETKAMKLIGYNKNMDIALLKINGNYNYLELEDSNNVRVGEKVIAIGNPLGLSFSVSEGIVSAVHREGNNNLLAYIQTDASLNPGNSGGPLIDSDGKVIGINNFKLAAESIGFALESNYIKDTVNEITQKSMNISILG
ncbi:MAG: trypsin-like peptidase domain-containing protein [Nanoarchaeota archaeon]